MFKISSVLFLGASVWRVSALRVSELDFEPVSAEPEVFTVVNPPEVSSEYEGALNLVLQGVVFNDQADLPGILTRTASWCYFRSWISDDTAPIDQDTSLFLSELYDWLCTANSPIIPVSQAVYPQFTESRNASVREARQFLTVMDMLLGKKSPSDSTISFEE